jgi:hypothetical protein
VAAGYEFLTMREYLRSDELPDRFVVMRHDVDRKPENAVDLARIEMRHGVSATYYFRTIEKTFDPAAIRRIEAMGHEIGYHYEDMDRTKGVLEAAHDSFARQLARLRRHATVETACMHGNPLTRYDNRDMWADADLTSHGILGEAYLDMDFTDIVYFSDTGRTWKDGALKIKDHTIGDDAKRTQVRTTPELIELLESGRIDRFCILTHPNRWGDGVPEIVAETTKDAVTNAGKVAMGLL